MYAADTALALRGWRAAKRWLRRQGWAIAEIIVHHDQHPVYTGCGWTGRLVLNDRARLTYALEGCPQPNEGEAMHV